MRVPFAIVAALSLCLPGSRLANGDDPQFRVGCAVVDITPTRFPVSSAGSMSPRSVDSAHDPLSARSFVIDDGKKQIAIVIVDSCMIPRSLFDRAKAEASKRTGIPPSCMLMAATHTHTAVTVTPAFQSAVEENYVEFLVSQLAESLTQAVESLQPAKVGTAVGRNANHVFNRRWYMRNGFPLADPFDRGTDRVRMNPPRGHGSLVAPAGLIDPQIPLLAFIDAAERPIGVLANYSLHYVGGVPGGALSADYFGEFARVFARKIDREGDAAHTCVVAMSNGTSGDINNINFFESAEAKEPFEQIRFVSEDLAASAKVAFDRIKFDNAATLDMLEREVELGVRKPSTEDIAFAQAVLATAGERPYRDRRAIYALETLDLAAYPETVRVKLQAVRIGELAIVTTPCETFVETGLAIKRNSPFHPTFTIELANGYNGYLPTREQHALGGYETWRAKSSYLAVDAEETIRAELLEMLETLAKNTRK